jgi:hypothetical protein
VLRTALELVGAVAIIVGGIVYYVERRFDQLEKWPDY